MNGQAAKTKKIFDGRYEILSIVGRGARSVVYHARHVSSPSTEVALKVLIDQKGKNPSAERLRREALAMVSCRHRYVARLDDFHSIGSLCYLSMEFAPESDLRAFVKRNGGILAIDKAERFLKQCAEAIAFIHRAGIIHRDIKPENILVMNDKEVRITDFGVALLPGEECSIADLQSGVGTMNYMAPEILEGKPADQRSDLYALGVVFYELLSGKNPFAGAPLARQIDARKSETIARLSQMDPSIPEYLSDLIAQCMRYEPDMRFNSGDDLLANLLNKKSADFSREQKAQRQKPVRPKTNDLHKRPRKVEQKPQTNEELDDADDLFAEFDKLVAEDAKTSSGEVESTIAYSDMDFSGENPSSKPTNYEQPVQEPPKKEEELSQSPELFDEGDDFFNDSQSTNDQGIFDDSDVSAQAPQTVMENPSQVNELADHISAAPDHEQEFEEDFEEDFPKNVRSASYSKSNKDLKLKQWITFAVSVVLFLGLILPGFRDSMFGAVRKGIVTLGLGSHSAIELPLYENAQLSFPNLPKGVFSGSIVGIVPGKSTPLTLISFGESGKIAVLLGIEGWSPVVIDQQDILARSNEGKESNLGIASNGLILEMTGEVKGGKIIGYFSSLINGTRGQWSVEPAV